MDDPSAEPGARTDGAAALVSRDLLYRSLFEHALVEVHIWELVRSVTGAIVNWRLVDANPAALRSWGRALHEVVGQTTDVIFPGAGAIETFLPLVEEITATGVPKEWETRFAGTEQVLRMISIPVGEFFVSTGFDVTADRTRQRELEDALRSLNQATQAGGVGLWDWDLDTDQVRYSDEWKRQLGYAPDEIADRFEEWQSRVHPDDLPPTLDRVRAKIEDASVDYNVAFRMRHKDGSYRWLLAQSSIIHDEAGRPRRMLGSHIDITERRRLEERALEAQKLESIGTLAAGIAHDFNNLLGAITGNLSLLRDISLTDPDAPELLRELDDAARRAAALTRQLLTFARGGAPVREVASIRELVVETATFVTRGSNVRCTFDMPPDLPNVEVDVGQLSQVVNNLVINAMQAMPSGGTVSIAGRKVVLPPHNALGLRAGGYVRISVEDEGSGIAPEVLPRIFDPFFTTKASGTGLGLSGSYSIVARHGGRITVRSPDHRGTIFDVHLPASDAAVGARAPTPTVAGRGRVLIMDDDPSIRLVFRRMLERLGYECEVARNGPEALHSYDDALRSGHRFDAVILDLTIPGDHGGAQVLSMLRQLDPDVKALVASGYANDDVLADFERYGFRGRILKPVDLASLSAELARVLQ